MKKIATTILIMLLASAACSKKSTNTSSGSGHSSSGAMTESQSGAQTQPGPRDLSGTWTVAQPHETWELVVTRTGPGTYSGSSTLLTTDDPKGIDGPPGSKGDDIVIVSDEPGKFRVRWAKAENFHKADFWNGTGTYDDNSFDFAGFYKGNRKS